MQLRMLTLALCLLGPLGPLAACAPAEPEVPGHACVSDDDPACTPVSQATADPFGGSPLAGRFVADLPEANDGARSAPGQAQALSQAQPPSARPAAHGRRDVRLHQARLDDAVRLLAREGDFNVVIHGDLPQTVTVDLSNVDPYDALLVLAETHGVPVRYRDGIVTVGALSAGGGEEP